MCVAQSMGFVCARTEEPRAPRRARRREIATAMRAGASSSRASSSSRTTRATTTTRATRRRERRRVKCAPDADVRRERGRDIRVTTTTFYRDESAQGRDLGVLAALTTRRRLEVLDATCASGARAARYAEAGVLKSMHANDVNADVEDVVRENLAELLSPASEVDVKLTFDDAQRVFARAWLEKTFYDFVDVDGFGAANFGDALKCVRYGGLFYATSTDARALCGQNPETLSRAFGNAVVAPSRPGVNEIALRVFIGDVVRRGAAIGISATPLFSLFHPHGPVFRVMFRVEKARGGAYDAFASNRDAAMGFVGFCDRCGDTSVVRAPLIDVYGHTKTIAPGDADATTTQCARCRGQGSAEDDRSAALAISGPLWLRSLHDRDTVLAMIEAADAQGWFDDDDESDSGPAKGQLSLRDLLDAFVGEADAGLERTPHHLRTDELGRKGRAKRVPPRDVLITALRAEGFAAARSHIDPRGLKTNATMADVVACANRVCEAIDELEGRA